MSLQARLLPDGKRLHLQHGPIDLIIGCDGEGAQVRRAYMAARARFDGLLVQLVEELPLLRTEMPRNGLGVSGPVAQRMEAAVQPHWRDRVSPMAAVAGAVADGILSAMLAASSLRRAYVNNGGDIAVYLADGEAFSIASANGLVAITSADRVGGIATSGWRGRSHSLGIAESVTVLARTAAEADVAATLVANAVDLPGHAAITRQPAYELSPDSDLGKRLVTAGVGPLNAVETAAALASGDAVARDFQRRGLIMAATLGLNGNVVRVEADHTVKGIATHG